MSEWEDERGFLCKKGRAYVEDGAYCNKKLCFAATDLDYLVKLLDGLADREDAYWVKYAPRDKDRMHLGRAFFTNERAVGELWKLFKSDAKVLCSVQDDDFTAAYR